MFDVPFFWIQWVSGELDSVVIRNRCAWLITYELGVARCLKEKVPQELFQTTKFTGTSSGSLIAAALATESDLNEVRHVIHCLRKEAESNWFGPVGNCSALVKGGLQQLMKPGIYRKANNRLYISITEQGHSFLPIPRNRLVSEFTSDENLMTTLMASCYIPLYYEQPVFLDNRICLDGGFSNNAPRIDGKTVVVSPNSKSSAQIKPQNAEFTFLDAFVFIPTIERMKEIESLGYHDCDTYWRENGEYLIHRIRTANQRWNKPVLTNQEF